MSQCFLDVLHSLRVSKEGWALEEPRNQGGMVTHIQDPFVGLCGEGLGKYTLNPKS